MQPLSPAPIQAPISFLAKTPMILEVLLRGVPADVLQWKPAAERWSITEVLGHLVAIEQLCGERLRRMATEDAPELAEYVAPPESEFGKKSARAYLEEFVVLRRPLLVFLNSIPAASAGRTGKHAGLGEITLSQMLHELANHDLGHLRQIAGLYRAGAFYPHTGPFQKYLRQKL